MECDQKLLRIGNNLYTLHTAVTCVKEHNDGDSVKSTEGDFKQPADDLLQFDESIIKLENDMTTAECGIKNETEEIPFDDDYDDESFGGNDKPGTSSFVQSAHTDDDIEIDDDSNEEAEEDANESLSLLSPGQNIDAPITQPSVVYNTKCGICKKLFLNEIELNTHMSVHMISTGSFECNVYFKRVKTKNSFRGVRLHCGCFFAKLQNIFLI